MCKTNVLCHSFFCLQRAADPYKWANRVVLAPQQFRRRGCEISRNAGQAKIAFSVHCAKLHRLPAALPLGLFRGEVRQIRWRGRIRRTPGHPTLESRASSFVRSIILARPSCQDEATSVQSWDGLMQITPGDLTDARVVDLLLYHLTSARAQTAPGSAHALDLNGLQSPDITFWTAWDGETLVAIGALKQISQDHGEVKSMHTVEAARRKGVGSAMLRYIIAYARSRAISRLSLETGSWDYFRPAVALYRKHGFTECPPFADYVPDPNSIFMTLHLRTQ